MTTRYLTSWLVAALLIASAAPANASFRTVYINGDLSPRCQPDRSHVASPQSPWQCGFLIGEPGFEFFEPHFGPSVIRAVFRHEVPIPEELPWMSSEDLVEVTLSAMPWLGIEEINFTPGEDGDNGGLLLRDVLRCGEACNDPNTAIPNIRGTLIDAKTGITVEFRDDRDGDDVVYRLPNGDVLWFKYFQWFRTLTTADPAQDVVPPPVIRPISQDGCINAAEAPQTVSVTGTAIAGAEVYLGWHGHATAVRADTGGNWSASLRILPDLPDGSLADGTFALVAYQLLPNSFGSFNPTGPVSELTRAFFRLDTISLPPSVPDLLPGSDTGLSKLDNITRLSSLKFTGESEAGATVALRVDSETGASGLADKSGTWAIFASGLPGGNHTAQVQQTDACGNESEPSGLLSFVIDKTLPTVSLDPIATDYRINRAESLSAVSIKGAAENGAAMRVTVQDPNKIIERSFSSGGSWQVSLSPAEIGSLADGRLVIKAKATDLAGNWRTVYRSVSKDTVIALPPTISAIAGNDVISLAEQATGITTGGTAEKGSVVTLTLAGLTRKTTASSTGQWSVALTKFAIGSLPVGTLQARAVATDRAGNVSQVATRSVQKQ